MKHWQSIEPARQDQWLSITQDELCQDEISHDRGVLETLSHTARRRATSGAYLKDPIDLYKEYFVHREYERLDLFQLLAERFGVTSALYPGSFVHITPSLVFPKTTYVDMDKRAKQFFQSMEVLDFVAQNKMYPQRSEMTFHPADYRQALAEPDESYDLLISQYAGFISNHCKRYLKINGVLLANNSHGDASMASIDPDYEFIGAILRDKGKHRISEKELDTYFVPKKPVDVSQEYLEQTQKGIGYRKTASSYLFRRVK